MIHVRHAAVASEAVSSSSSFAWRVNDRIGNRIGDLGAC